MQLPGAILTAGLFIAAQCQLFDRSEVADGGSFNLTCDVGRVGSVPAAVKKIYYLSIDKAVSSNRFTIIAVYSTIPSESLTKNIPNGRAWVIEASGGTGSVEPGSNRASIKVTLYVTDAQCADAGLYNCKAGFAPTDGVAEASRSQKMTFKGICNSGTRLGIMASTRFFRNMFLVETAMFLWSRVT